MSTLLEMSVAILALTSSHILIKFFTPATCEKNRLCMRLWKPVDWKRGKTLTKGPNPQWTICPLLKHWKLCLLYLRLFLRIKMRKCALYDTLIILIDRVISFLSRILQFTKVKGPFASSTYSHPTFALGPFAQQYVSHMDPFAHDHVRLQYILIISKN